MRSILQRAGARPTRAVPAPVRPSETTLEHLRVVVFSDAIPGRNGVGTFYDDLAAALEEHVGAIRIVAPPLEPTPSEQGWSLPMPGDPMQRMHVPWVPQLWKQVRWTRPHVVLAATPSLYGLTGLLMARRVGAGAALCYHTEFPELAESYWRGARALVLPRLLALWDRILLRSSPVVLAPNHDLAEALARKGRRDARVMATLAPKRFVDEPPPPAPERVSTVVFVGRLAPEKRIDHILAAARTHRDVRFRVVGDGPVRDEVVRAAGELSNLEHLPWMERDGVLRVLDTSDLLVLPSSHETFGTAAFEAMVRGRLTLVSPECGITGWPRLAPGLLTMDAGESLPGALSRVRRLTPARLRTIAETARAVALEVHAGAVREWLELLRALAAQRTR